MADVTEAEIRKIVAETVAETLLKLGIDSSDPILMQKDFQQVRAWREATETVKRQGLIAAVGFITVGILGLIWLAIKSH